MYHYKITFTHFLGVSETLYVSLSQKLTRQLITDFLCSFKYGFVSYTVETLDVA